MSKPKILLVESDGTESRVFVETCECHGLEVMVVANGHEAVVPWRIRRMASTWL